MLSHRGIPQSGVARCDIRCISLMIVNLLPADIIRWWSPRWESIFIEFNVSVFSNCDKTFKIFRSLLNKLIDGDVGIFFDELPNWFAHCCLCVCVVAYWRVQNRINYQLIDQFLSKTTDSVKTSMFIIYRVK